MFFHKKTKDIDPKFYEKYQVLCGIEEEFLIVNGEGSLVEAADEMMKKAAEILEISPDLLDTLRVQIRGLDAEPNPAQIEYVTLPLPPTDLEEATKAGRKLLKDAAEKLGVKLFAQSLHPIQSDPHPIVGTHINVSVQKKGNLMKPSELKAVNNYLWNFLPELIAVTANPPIYQGNVNNIASNRCANSTVLKMNDPAKIEIPENKPALVPMRYYGRMRYQLKIGSATDDEFSKKVITNPKGDRLVDITPRGPFTNIGDDKDESPTRNRVEVRIIDVQHKLEDMLDIAYLCCLSGLHALYLNQTGEILLDPYHKTNVENAIAHGMDGTFQRKNGIEESLEESLATWVEQTEKYQDYLGIEIKNLPTEKLERKLPVQELEANYRTRRIEKIRQQGKTYVTVRIGETRVISDGRGNKYKISAGAKIKGKLSADFQLDYKEEDGMIAEFRGLKIVNILKVQGVKIPLTEKDRIVSSYSEAESLASRLFSGFDLFNI
ncbi:MAG: hypothetical protein ACOC35_11015 [Promethearchaeia archaeon]